MVVTTSSFFRPALSAGDPLSTEVILAPARFSPSASAAPVSRVTPR
jgi:hypothetical protein